MESIDLIAKERVRQVEGEGYDEFHDNKHRGGALACASACYIAPQKILTEKRFANLISYGDPWPWPGQYCDKRYTHVEGNVLPDPYDVTLDQRIDFLVKGAALAAAELDRLIRLKEVHDGSEMIKDIDDPRKC